MTYENDQNITISNRKKLFQNQNLLYWYKTLFDTQFKNISDIQKKNILEIGSGTSPIKRFIPNVMTSDIMNLEYLDYVFDCHKIDTFAEIPDESVDIISMTNVLHHVKYPIDFLQKSHCKLKPGGMVIIAEPYFSFFSNVMYKYLHHEPVDFYIKKPEINQIDGPLSSANIALPYLIFFLKNDWRIQFRQKYDIDNCEIEFFTFISYPITGGISRRFPIPQKIYRIIFKVDHIFSKLFPKFCASFFILKMKKI